MKFNNYDPKEGINFDPCKYFGNYFQPEEYVLQHIKT